MRNAWIDYINTKLSVHSESERSIMKLFRAYSKIMIVRNYKKYLLLGFSIVLVHLLNVITMIYLNLMLSMNTAIEHSVIRYKVVGILTVFFIAGFIIILHQYLNIMKSGMRDYYILLGLGATKRNIQFLIFVQSVFLIVISIPIGLLCGYALTGFITGYLGEYTLNHNILGRLTSVTTLLLVAGVIGSYILSIAVYLERKIRKLPLSYIFSDRALNVKGGNVW